jgi:hypothetical protein
MTRVNERSMISDLRYVEKGEMEGNRRIRESSEREREREIDSDTFCWVQRTITKSENSLFCETPQRLAITFSNFSLDLFLKIVFYVPSQLDKKADIPRLRQTVRVTLS